MSEQEEIQATSTGYVNNELVIKVQVDKMTADKAASVFKAHGMGTEQAVLTFLVLSAAQGVPALSVSSWNLAPQKTETSEMQQTDAQQQEATSDSKKDKPKRKQKKITPEMVECVWKHFEDLLRRDLENATERAEQDFIEEYSVEDEEEESIRADKEEYIKNNRYKYYHSYTTGDLREIADKVAEESDMSVGSAFIYLNFLSNLVSGEGNTRSIKESDLIFLIESLEASEVTNGYDVFPEELDGYEEDFNVKARADNSLYGSIQYWAKNMPNYANVVRRLLNDSGYIEDVDEDRFEEFIER